MKNKIGVLSHGERKLITQNFTEEQTIYNKNSIDMKSRKFYFLTKSQEIHTEEKEDLKFQLAAANGKQKLKILSD